MDLDGLNRFPENIFRTINLTLLILYVYLFKIFTNVLELLFDESKVKGKFSEDAVDKEVWHDDICSTAANRN